MFKIASFLLASIVFFISPAPAVLASSWTNDVLISHNAARAQYGAKPLAWNANLYAGTQQWASQCKPVHSNSREYGENLYYDTRNVGIQEAVNYWMSEAPKYDYNKPGFSQATGHFTQVVWKSTTSVACARASCPNGTISSVPTYFFVCRYAPPGNYQGLFPQNVGRP
ncbi:MAG: CAP domain-containing protein [Podila humilis]|nr:MAG: CAP domain-containing protein [Podila humilis]